MARTKISEFSATAADNTDIDNIDIAEGCAPSGINNAIRELMAQLKDFQTGAAGDPFNGAVNGTVGATTPAAGAFTTLSASSTVSGTGFSNYLASPPAIGGTAAAAVSSTNLAYTGTLTGSTGIINIGSGQVYKDASGNVGVGTASPAYKLDISGGNARISSGASSTDLFMVDTGTTSGNVRIRSESNALKFITGGGVSATLDASGNLGLGVTPSAWGSGFKSLDLGSGSSLANANSVAQTWLSTNAYYNAGWKYKNTASASLYESDSAHKWFTAPSGTAGNAISFTERLLMNPSGLSGLFVTANDGFQVSSSEGAGTSWANFVGRHSGGATFGGTASFVVYNNGNVLNTNNSYGALSDLKLKENIVPATPKLDKLLQVEVVNYNLKDFPENKLLGVVAQQLEQVFPSLVQESPDRDEEGNDLGTTTKSVKYSVFVPMLIKAVQELSAQQASLKAEFDAYKAAHP